MAEIQEQREGVERQSYLRIHFKGRIFRTAQPMAGPGTYVSVLKEILSKGLRLPTGEERAFELDRVYNFEDTEFRESLETKSVRQIMKYGVIWVPNRQIWTPENARSPGLYVVFDEKAEGVSAPFDLTELEDRLSGGQTERGVRFSQDRAVRFAPRNTFSLGSQNGALAQSGFVIANYDVEGAEKLDKVAPKLGRGRPYINGVSGNAQPEQRVAALGHPWYFGRWLSLLGDCLLGDRYGFASGVCESE